MNEIVGQVGQLGWVVLKALLLFATAVVGLRLSERRTVAQLGLFDLVVAVATGAIVGRTATSSTTAFLAGAVALLTLLAVHRLVAVLRRRGALGHVLDRRPLVLVADGALRDEEMRKAGLSRSDAMRLLRLSGVGDPADVQYVLFEDEGTVSVVPHGALGAAHRAGLEEAGVDLDDEQAAHDDEDR